MKRLMNAFLITHLIFFKSQSILASDIQNQFMYFDNGYNLYINTQKDSQFLQLSTQNILLFYDEQSKVLEISFYNDFEKTTFEYQKISSLQWRFLKAFKTPLETQYLLDLEEGQTLSKHRQSDHSTNKCDTFGKLQTKLLDPMVMSINSVQAMGFKNCSSATVKYAEQLLVQKNIFKNLVKCVRNKFNDSPLANKLNAKFKTLFEAQSGIKLKCDKNCKVSNISPKDEITICSQQVKNKDHFNEVFLHELRHSKFVEMSEELNQKIEKNCNKFTFFQTETGTKVAAATVLSKKIVSQKIEVPEKLKYIESPPQEEFKPFQDPQPVVVNQSDFYYNEMPPEQLSMVKSQARPIAKIGNYIAQAYFPSANAQEYKRELHSVLNGSLESKPIVIKNEFDKINSDKSQNDHIQINPLVQGSNLNTERSNSMELEIIREVHDDKLDVDRDNSLSQNKRFISPKGREENRITKPELNENLDSTLSRSLTKTVGEPLNPNKNVSKALVNKNEASASLPNGPEYSNDTSLIKKNEREFSSGRSQVGSRKMASVRSNIVIDKDQEGFYNYVSGYKPEAFFKLYFTQNRFKKKILSQIENLNLKIIDGERQIVIEPKSNKGTRLDSKINQVTIRVVDEKFVITN